MCEPIFKKIKKGVNPEGDQKCQEAFDKIKEYLSNLIVMVPLQPSIPLILYLTITTMSFGAMLAQNIEGEKMVVCYLSKTSLHTSRENPFSLSLHNQEA